MTWKDLTPPGAEDALVALAAILLMYALLIGQAFGLAALPGDRAIVLVALPFMIVIAVVVPAWLLLRYLRINGIETGFRALGKRGWHLIWQVPAVIVASATLAATVGPVIGLSPGERETAMEKTALDGQHLPILFMLAAYLLLGPFLEELVYRRVLMGYFDTVMPAAVSVVLSSVLFGIAHVSPPAILYATFFGIGCALVTRWHGTLWAGFIVHMLNNTWVQLVTFALL